jgi:hypothetical protein
MRLVVESGAELVAAVGEQEAADEVVVSEVFREAGSQPLLQGDGLAGARRVDFRGQNAVAPRGRHVRGVTGRVEQPIDELLPFVGALIGEEFANLRGTGDDAGQVEADPAEKLGFIGRRGRFHLFSGPLFFEEGVDAGGHLGAGLFGIPRVGNLLALDPGRHPNERGERKGD